MTSRTKIEIELPGRGFDTEARVCHVAGDISRDGRRRKLDLLISIDARAVQLVLGQKLIEE